MAHQPTQDDIAVAQAHLATRMTFVRFGSMVGAISLVFMFRTDEAAHGGVFGAFVIAACITAMRAATLREPMCGPTLNRWDETLAYLGLSSLAVLVF